MVTVGRSDFGLYTPVLRAIAADPELQLQLIVGGAHLTPESGWTVNAVAEAGFEIADRVDMTLAADTPEAVAIAMGLGTMGFARSYARLKPDILLVLGDRYEMHAAAVAAVPMRIPIAHIHGGEITEGAIDDVFRHAITKYAHLHFVAMEEYARRVVQMGEEPWRVTVSGGPALDNLHNETLLEREQLSAKLAMDLDKPTLLVTYHPVTLEYDDTERQVTNLLAALERCEHQVVLTYPNADTYGQRILPMIREFCDRCPRAKAFANLGTVVYFGLMNHAAAMVGNSSSGICEAASFRLPVVDVGNRQRGRHRAQNVVHTGYEVDEILDGIRRATAPEFRQGLVDLVNPYGDGHAAERIVERLKEVALDERLLAKRFWSAELGVRS